MDAPDFDRAAEMSVLCRSCGFCCDGTLNFWAKLEPYQVAGARRCGLDVRDTPTEVGFTIPCSQLQGHRCAVYDQPDRPTICRTYRCWLSQRLMEGSVRAEEAAETIHHVDALKRAVAARIGPERAAGWARGAKHSFAATGAGGDELPEEERRQFAEWIADVPGARDEDGTVHPEMLRQLFAAGRVLQREFVWPKETRERLLRQERDAGIRAQHSPDPAPDVER